MEDAWYLSPTKDVKPGDDQCEAAPGPLVLLCSSEEGGCSVHPLV